jgi:hypothetical protein
VNPGDGGAFHADGVQTSVADSKILNGGIGVAPRTKTNIERVLNRNVISGNASAIGQNRRRARKVASNRLNARVTNLRISPDAKR